MEPLKPPRPHPSRKRTRGRLAALVVGVGLAGSMSGAALAAPPANDLPAGAIAISAIPATIDQTTSEATVSTDDIGCGSGGTDQATVWYSLTLGSDLRIAFDASGSDYAVGINVFESAATSDNLVDCAANALAVDVAAGTTYYVMFADIDENATNGGHLAVSVDVAPPAIDVTLTVDPVGKVNPRTGEATITGTISCSSQPDFVDISVDLRQPVGRFTIHGFGFAGADCGTEPTSWLATITGDNGKFSAGRATASVDAFACDQFSCDEEFITANVRLRR
jgi:hypothetical protein